LPALALLALTGIPAGAQALDQSDVGNYAVIHRDGHVTDFISFISLKDGEWNIEHLQPDGTWDKVTCEDKCTLHESKPADLKRFFTPDDLKQIKPSCVHNSAFAFCNYTMDTHPGRTGYLLIALERTPPVTVQLKRLDPAWKDQEGRLAPDTDARKSAQGFGGWMIVTPDADWKEKWNTSPETIPRFRTATEVEYGGHLSLLTFFANPQPDAGGEIKVLCDIKITRPDGSVPVDRKGVECASGKLQGDPRNMRLTSAVIEFIGEKGDPPGVWRAEVTLTDKNRNVSMPLRAEFTLVKKAEQKGK
jgi:hypothetical protein